MFAGTILDRSIKIGRPRRAEAGKRFDLSLVEIFLGMNDGVTSVGRKYS